MAELMGGSIPMMGASPTANQINPFEAIRNMADTQRTLIQAQTAQQEYAAKGAAAEVLSLYPDLQSGVKALSNTAMAPWIPQVLQGLADTDRTMVAASQGRQNLTNTAMGTVMQGLSQQNSTLGWSDTLWNQYVNAGAANIDDPRAKANFITSMKSMRDAITNGGTVMNGSMMDRNIRSQLMTHISPEVANSFSAGLLTGPGEVTAIPPLAGSGPVFGAQPGTTGQPAMDRPLPGPAYGQGSGGGAAGAAPPQSVPLAGDGTPLTPNYGSLPSGYQPVQVQTGTGGAYVKGDPSATRAQRLLDEYDAPETVRAYRNAASSLGNLQFMDNALDTMLKSGNFLAPGPGSEARIRIATLGNQFAQAIGIPNPFDPKAVGTAEDFYRQTRQLGIQTLTTLLGNQREAEGTINNIISTMPGTENTYLGGKMLIAGIRAQVQRALEMRQYQSDWLHDQGNLINSVEGFNTEHQADRYTDAALAEHGMGANMTGRDIINFTRRGYLTTDQRDSILQSGFGPDGSRLPRTPTGGAPQQ